ncbi:DUF484 family protein [Wenzhouxiangella sediminis]|uniref:DUF484 family protein n=1 Tax=Wenzhouxiangella sediminis TaxID=1792836 RepID=A0A3E1K6Z2_9GAMM|nr:DUF484 family protein [Wenzhouxiangella sediminis]RFF29444.1 DUF484 family protein [Wenzhouxiangella sediminis]
MPDPSRLNEEDVIEWLTSNADFFERHPELLEWLKLPHETGAHSLIEVQVTRLRRENHQLRAQLETLAGIAGENERLMQRLHQLTLEVMTTRSAGEFIERLIGRLASDFDARSVRLHLLEKHDALGEVAAVTTHDTGVPEWFEKLLEQGNIEFGRFTRAKLETLFPRQHEDIGSAALVPIAGVGLLAIGSESPERFHPGMGTLFLELLGTTIRHRLEQDRGDERKRA